MYYSNSNEKLNSYDIKKQNNDNFSNNYGAEIFTLSPTQDKKQFCTTGQFAGFYVRSSVYCNLQIPSGPAGQQSETGPQGPSGITQLNGNNTYVVTAHSFNNIPSANANFARATYDSGDFVLTGGYSITRFIGDLGDTWEEFDKPFFYPLPSGWEVKIGRTGTVTVVECDVYAVCFDNPPLRS